MESKRVYAITLTVEADNEESLLTRPDISGLISDGRTLAFELTGANLLGIRLQPAGIVRYIDDLGRVVIPQNIRDRIGFEDGDPIELFVCDGGVLLRKYESVR